MEYQNIWGQLGDLVFRNYYTPITGSYSEIKTAVFRQIESYEGKNLKQPAGMELTTINFSITIPDIPLKLKDTTPAERLVATTGLVSTVVGALAGTVFSQTQNFNYNLKVYKGLMGDAKYFEEILEEMQANQLAYPLTIGNIVKGNFTINNIRKSHEYQPNGRLKLSRYDITLEEAELQKKEDTRVNQSASAMGGEVV